METLLWVSQSSEALAGRYGCAERRDAYVEQLDQPAPRPDFYVFGSVPAAEELRALLDDLSSQLHLTSIPTRSGALA